MNALTRQNESRENGQTEDWSDDRSLCDDGSYDESGWGEWNGFVDDWSWNDGGCSDWSWDDGWNECADCVWSNWNDAEQKTPSISRQQNAPQSAPQTEQQRAQNVAALVTDPSLEIFSNLPQYDPGNGSVTTGQRVRAVRGAKPGLLSNLFIETCLLVATLGAMMVAPDELPSLSDIQSGAVDPDMIGDKLSELHMQAGLTDCCIMLFKTKSFARLSARGMWQVPPGKFSMVPGFAPDPPLLSLCS